MIKVSNLCQKISNSGAQVDLLSNISFEIPQTEMVALMGESGSGKTTLLNSIGGFIPVLSGKIEVLGQDITSLDDRALSAIRRQHFGVVFQQYNLIGSLTALENITFVRRLNGRMEIDQYTQDLIETLQLKKLLGKKIQQLSGGEQQRVAIARALAHRPAIILADEPTGSLDEKTSSVVMEQFVDAISLNSSTLLLVTHSQKVASYLSKTWQLENGEIKY